MTQRYLTRPHPSTSFPPTFPFALTALTPHDPSSDRSFYSSPRFVNHIDDNAISQLSAFYDDVLPRSSSTLSSTSSSLPSRILDVCSSWVSHIPLNTRTKQPKAREIGMEVIGLGMNTKELAANPILSGWVIHDLNEEPSFGTALVSVQPGPARDSEQATTGEEGFDAVICNVSIDYLSRPLEVMAFIAGSLRPGCSAYMAVSNRCFLTKVVSPWLSMSTSERIDLVASYFHFAGTPYSGDAAGAVKPGELFEGIESLVIVPEGRRTDPLWVVRAKRRGAASAVRGRAGGEL